MPISEFQFQQMLMRMRRPAPETRSAEACKEENELHREIIDHCESVGWLYFRSASAYKTRRRQGEPDFHVWADGGRKFAFECKSRRGKLSTEQLGIIAWAKKLGHTVHVIDNFKQFLEVVT